MTPFRVGDDVRVRPNADSWFANAEGTVMEVYEESGTLMVRLVSSKRGHLPNPLTLPFGPSELEATRCQHPQIGEGELRAYLDRRWEGLTPLCPDCKEWLYAEDDNAGGIRIYVGEPRGAGATVAW